MKVSEIQDTDCADFDAITPPAISPTQIAQAIPPSHCEFPPHSSALDLADQIINDPATPYWVAAALVGAFHRDICDAVNDAEILLSVLSARLEELQGGAK